ncbi:MAG TPA: hypothetical protein VG986_10625 [Pseudolabrys sp.]|nr:hypothetical protein [Pseudolabrys sp.]
MPRQSDPSERYDSVAAIERVLQTERAGVAALRESEERAQHLRADARARAAGLAARADRCISRLHSAYLQKIEREVKAIAQAHPGTGDSAPAYDRDALEAAARRIAARLTGTS